MKSIIKHNSLVSYRQSTPRIMFRGQQTNIQLQKQSESRARRADRWKQVQRSVGLPRWDFTCHLQRPGGVQRTERVPGAQTGPLHHVVIGSAEQSVFPQRELVPRDELPAARHAAETFDVVDFGPGSHHEVVLAETDVAFCAFNPV